MNSSETTHFETYRPLMFSIAYRMLGSATDAEDIVQEAYLRYQKTAPEQIISHKAFLSTIVTRLCLSQLQAARTQRETYIGPWLPEPVLTDGEPSTPTQHVELHESLSMAFLVLLEQLTPIERAVFLLREVFGYEYAEIAGIIGKTEGACRQVFSRAKKHIAENRPRFTPTPDAHRHILAQFLRATVSGDLDGLMHLLAEDVTLWADGGGKARGAITKPLHGRDAVARFLAASPRIPSQPYQPAIQTVNGEPAVVLQADGQPRLVLFVSTDQGQISAIHAVGNPDKLHWVSKKKEVR